MPVHSVASGEKEEIMLPLSDHFTLIKDRPSLRALKYIDSKATYPLSMSKSCQFTV